MTHLDKLAELKPLADDSSFLDSIIAAKYANKKRLATFLLREYAIEVNPDSMFDIHVSPFCRMHTCRNVKC